MMKQEIQYSLKIEFEELAENPSRIFLSMSNLIDSFKDFDYMLATSINTNLKFRQLLKTIEVSSLTSKIIDELTYDDQQSIGEDIKENEVKTYFNNSRKTILKKLDENKIIDDREIIEEIYHEIEDNARKSGVTQSVKFKNSDRLTIAKNLDIISNALKNLGKNEKALYEIGDDSTEINKVCEVSLEKIRDELLADEELKSESIVILKIKKPDFLGDSMWLFKHGNTSITAKITDDEWLSKFHSGIIPMVPNDAMKVRMRETIRYDRKGNVISTYNEIFEIINLIHNLDSEQIEVLK